MLFSEVIATLYDKQERISKQKKSYIFHMEGATFMELITQILYNITFTKTLTCKVAPVSDPQRGNATAEGFDAST